MPSILKVAENVGQTNVLNILRDVEMQLDGGPVRRGPRASPRLYILFYAACLASVPDTRLPFWYVWLKWRRACRLTVLDVVKRPHAEDPAARHKR